MSRTGPRAAGTLVVLACLAMAVWAGTARANFGFHKSFGEGELLMPSGVATDAAGDIYIGNMLVFGGSKFNLADEPVVANFFGGFGDFSGVAVNPASGDVYFVNAEEHEILSLDADSGELVHSFPVPGTSNLTVEGTEYTTVQIASDSLGNVYVPAAPGDKIEVFSETGSAPAGAVTPDITGAGPDALKAPEGVAIGPEGNVWVADTGNGRIEEFEADGTFVKEVSSPGVRAVALDAAGDLFASIGGAETHVVEYSPSGAVIDGAIGEGLISESSFGQNGIAFDRSREILYVADAGANGVVQRFVSWALSAGPASDVTESGATLSGTLEVEPGNSVSSCTFEYGPTTAYGKSAPCSPGGPYMASTPVSASVSGLAPGDYHYRVSATGAGGFTQAGQDRVFGQPEISGESAEAIVTTATPRAHVTLPTEGEATCQAQYATEAQFLASGYAEATTVPCTKPIGSAPGEYRVETAPIEGLMPGTTYYFRFIASNQAGVAAGPDQTFTTFGVSSFAFGVLGPAGEQIIQAGAHPSSWTDTFMLNTSTHMFANGTTDPLAPDANVKDIVTELPPGLIGDPNATPRCAPYNVAHADCSGASQVGVLEVYTANPGFVENNGELEHVTPVPIYNLVPPKGVAAQLGARFNGFVTVHIDARVRTGGDYGVTAEALYSSAEEGVVGAEVTLWGMPAAAAHDGERYCPSPGHVNEESPCSEHGPPVAFLSNPTACTGERLAHMRANSWQAPTVYEGADAKLPAITGCGRLDFKPSMVVQPTSTASDSPSGLHVELNVPQNEDPAGLAEADLKDATVTLPAGITINPSAANGLAGCPLLTGKEGHAGQTGIDLENAEAAHCPEPSKVGTVRIKTPLLEEELTGGVYVAQQGNAGAAQGRNPFGSLLALYIAAEAPERGVIVKLAGHVELNPLTGQLTTTFDENPQLPFETLKLDLFGGERAPLATPRVCGLYQPTALLEPFSHQGAPGEEGTPDAEPLIAPSVITSGPHGSSCSATSGFSPSFAAGTTNPQSGRFSPFTMTLTRQDGEQRFSSVATTMPPGLEGMVSTVPLCREPQANAGTCPAASQIGHVTVQAGVGSEPITLPEAGKPQDPVYLTESYDGAPFGLAIVVPTEAGPFNLGTVVTRAKLEVDPRTAQVSVRSSPLPTILQGVPVDVRAINVTIDRPSFTFNPTNCDPLTVAGRIDSAEGAVADVSSHFEVANCATLPFNPSFTVSTSGKTSKAGGASLHVKLTQKPGEANIHKVDLQLPHALPSRLTTLQKACSEAQFSANPAGCPAGSVIGTATARSPVLQVPLTGAAYLVSHAAAAFPDVVFVLQGDERGGVVRIDVVGNTDIKKGITYSRFESVPDTPISSFETTLPEGPHSALAANGDLCAQSLVMPTTLVGQNGAQVKQRRRISVIGCKGIKITKRRLSGKTVVLSLFLTARGRVTVTGRGLKRYSKTLSAGSHQVKVALSKAGLSMRRHHGKIKIEVALHNGTNSSSAATSLKL